MKSPLIKMAKKHPAVYKELANHFIENGEFRKAKKALMQYINEYPDDHSGLIVKGLLEEKQMHYDDAEKIYRVILNADPRNIRALSRLVNLENMKRSPSDFWKKRLLQVDPLSPLVKELPDKTAPASQLPTSEPVKEDQAVEKLLSPEKPERKIQESKGVRAKPGGENDELLKALAKQFNLDEEETEKIGLIFREGANNRKTDDEENEVSSEFVEEEKPDLTKNHDESENEDILSSIDLEGEDVSLTIDTEPTEDVEDIEKDMDAEIDISSLQIENEITAEIQEDSERSDMPESAEIPDEVDQESIEKLLAELRAQTEGEIEISRPETETQEAEAEEFDEDFELRDSALSEEDEDSIDTFIKQAAEKSDELLQAESKKKFDKGSIEQSNELDDEVEDDSIDILISQMKGEEAEPEKEIADSDLYSDDDEDVEGGADEIDTLIEEMNSESVHTETEEEGEELVGEIESDNEIESETEEIVKADTKPLEELVDEELDKPEIEEEIPDKKVVLLDPETGLLIEEMGEVEPISDEPETEIKEKHETETSELDEEMQFDQVTDSASESPVSSDKVDELMTAFHEIDEGRGDEQRETPKKKIYSTTLAELFASQGNFEKALDIYNSFPEEIKAQHIDRIKELEQKVKKP